MNSMDVEGHEKILKKKQKLHIKLFESKSPARRRIYKQKLQKHLRKLKEII